MRWVYYMDFDGCNKGLREGGGQLDLVRSAENIAERLEEGDTRWSVALEPEVAAVADAAGELYSRVAVVGGVRVEGPVGGGDDAA